MKKILASLILAHLLMLTPSFAVEKEMWMSSAGSSIEAVYVGSDNSIHWLASTSGKLFKLRDDQLSEVSLKRIHEIQKRIEKLETQHHIMQSSLMPKDDRQQNEDLIIAVCSSKISALDFKSTPLPKALSEIEEQMGARLNFKLEGGIEDREIKGITALRNADVFWVLGLICNQQSLYYEIEDGHLVFRPNPW